MKNFLKSSEKRLRFITRLFLNFLWGDCFLLLPNKSNMIPGTNLDFFCRENHAAGEAEKQLIHHTLGYLGCTPIHKQWPPAFFWEDDPTSPMVTCSVWLVFESWDINRATLRCSQKGPLTFWAWCKGPKFCPKYATILLQLPHQSPSHMCRVFCGSAMTTDDPSIPPGDPHFWEMQEMLGERY